MDMEWKEIFELFPDRTSGAVRTRWHMLQGKRSVDTTDLLGLPATSTDAVAPRDDDRSSGDDDNNNDEHLSNNDEPSSFNTACEEAPKQIQKRAIKARERRAMHRLDGQRSVYEPTLSPNEASQETKATSRTGSSIPRFA
ncbi:hypothetical protein K469DRAFT_689636 [Zopfia rhizophila CBS 207.26]|uniref:Myb-like domain-containing protein n=1 Tax=Zopfia rhizophila CBS 207.26 TaxID=1314779 RepID=A0A6A6DW22_9PEZI|nr:hypothetical protein K469DRAFT_689636 [Zopfia rhizophila CBS 207.26]